MNTELMIALIGAVTTIIGVVVTFKTTKKKYKVENESTEILNLKDAFYVYKIIIDDNKKVIDELIEQKQSKDAKIDELFFENKKLNNKMDEMIQSINDLSKKICLKQSCDNRITEIKNTKKIKK